MKCGRNEKMPKMKRMPGAFGAFVALVALLANAVPGVGPGPACADPAPFLARLSPDTAWVAVGDTTTVIFYATESAQQFNAYDLAVSFDPALLNLVSVEQGDLMTGACGTTFAYLDSTTGEFTYSHSLLCADTSLDGPGELCLLGFRGLADGIAPLTILSDPNCTFFDAGICINPSHSTFPREVTLETAVLVVGDVPVEVDPFGPSRGVGAELRFGPNPTRGGGAFRLGLPSGGAWRLEVFDAAGRRIETRHGMSGSAGTEVVPWIGSRSAGALLSGGVYFARLTTPTGQAATRVVLVR